MKKQNDMIETQYQHCIEFAEEIKKNINELLASGKFKNLYETSKKLNWEQICVKECLEKLINLEKLVEFEIPHLDNSIHILKQSIYKSSIEKLSMLYEI